MLPMPRLQMENAAGHMTIRFMQNQNLKGTRFFFFRKLTLTVSSLSAPQFQFEVDKCIDEEVMRWWELARDWHFTQCCAPYLTFLNPIYSPSHKFLLNKGKVTVATVL